MCSIYGIIQTSHRYYTLVFYDIKNSMNMTPVAVSGVLNTQTVPETMCGRGPSPGLWSGLLFKVASLTMP